MCDTSYKSNASKGQLWWTDTSNNQTGFFKCFVAFVITCLLLSNICVCHKPVYLYFCLSIMSDLYVSCHTNYQQKIGLVWLTIPFTMHCTRQLQRPWTTKGLSRQRTTLLYSKEWEVTTPYLFVWRENVFIREEFEFRRTYFRRPTSHIVLQRTKGFFDVLVRADTIWPASRKKQKLGYQCPTY